ARRVTLNHVDQVSTRPGRACMDTVGCHLASEQPVRLHDSIAIWRSSGEVAEPIGVKGCKRVVIENDTSSLILDWFLLGVVDHQDRYGAFLSLQLQSELFFDRFEQRDCSRRVRGFAGFGLCWRALISAAAFSGRSTQAGG